MTLPTNIELEIHKDSFAPVLQELKLQFFRDPKISEVKSCINNMTRISQTDTSLEFRVHESKSSITNYEDLMLISQKKINEGLDMVLVSLNEIPLAPQEISISAIMRYNYIKGNLQESNSKLNFSLDFIKEGRNLEDCFIFPEAVAKITTYFTSKTDGLTTLEYLVKSSEHFDMLSSIATQQHLMVILGPPIFLSFGAPLMQNGNLHKLFSTALKQCRALTTQEAYRTPEYKNTEVPISIPLNLPGAITGSYNPAQFRSAGLTTIYNYRAGIFGVGFFAFFGLYGQSILGGVNQNLLYRGFWNMLLPAKPTIAEQAGLGLNKVTTGFFRGLFRN